MSRMRPAHACCFDNPRSLAARVDARSSITGPLNTEDAKPRMTQNRLTALAWQQANGHARPSKRHRAPGRDYFPQSKPDLFASIKNPLASRPGLFNYRLRSRLAVLARSNLIR